MKKYLLATFCLATLSAQAQMAPESTGSYTYSYAQDRVEQGYNVPVSYQNNAYANPAYVPGNPAPVSPQVYGFYQQPVEQNYDANYPRPQMMWYPTQQQRAVASGQMYQMPSSSSAQEMPQQPDVYQSPVYAISQKGSWYIDLRLGIGGTDGWENDFDIPVGPIWGFAIGKKISPNVRVDAEFDYHLKAKLAKTALAKIEYKQYDLGANIYYDFPLQSHVRVRPFIGAGIWAVDGKTTVSSKKGTRISSADSDIKLGLSGALGIAYPISEVLSLIAMARARYIMTKEELWNIEGLLGIRYHF